MGMGTATKPTKSRSLEESKSVNNNEKRNREKERATTRTHLFINFYRLSKKCQQLRIVAAGNDRKKTQRPRIPKELQNYRSLCLAKWSDKRCTLAGEVLLKGFWGTIRIPYRVTLKGIFS